MRDCHNRQTIDQLFEEAFVVDFAELLKEGGVTFIPNSAIPSNSIDGAIRFDDDPSVRLDQSACGINQK